VDPTDALDSFTLAKTFRKGAEEVRKYDIEAEKAEYVENSILEDVKVVSNVAGYLIKAVIA
jgi:hypothetical protein